LRVGVATNNNLDLAPFFSGVALDVHRSCPATPDHPAYSSDGQRCHAESADGHAQGVTNSLPLAFSQVRESDSVVKAKSASSSSSAV